MRRVNIRRRVCGWSVCRRCRGTGYRDSALAWERYWRIHDQLTDAHERITAGYRAGKATQADVALAVERLTVHLEVVPGDDCGGCAGFGAVRRRGTRPRRRARRRP